MGEAPDGHGHTARDGGRPALLASRGAGAANDGPTVHDNSPQEREGHWRNDQNMYVVMEAKSPHHVKLASSDWLEFCGFRPDEIIGKTLSPIRGPMTERSVISSLMEAVRELLTEPPSIDNPQPSIRRQLTNYTKRGVCFTNHIYVTQQHIDDRSCSDANAVELVVRTEWAEVLNSRTPVRFRASDRAAASATEQYIPEDGAGPRKLRRSLPPRIVDLSASEAEDGDAECGQMKLKGGISGRSGAEDEDRNASLDGCIMSNLHDDVDGVRAQMDMLADPQRA